jgi:hypothetical protein
VVDIRTSSEDKWQLYITVFSLGNKWVDGLRCQKIVFHSLYLENCNHGPWSVQWGAWGKSSALIFTVVHCAVWELCIIALMRWKNHVSLRNASFMEFWTWNFSMGTSISKYSFIISFSQAVYLVWLAARSCAVDLVWLAAPIVRSRSSVVGYPIVRSRSSMVGCPDRAQ